MKTFAYPPPTDGKPFRLTLGLRELQAKEWFEAGSDVEEQLQQRRELIKTSREVVYQQLPGHHEAITYFIDRIVENLTTHHDEYSASGKSLTHTPTNFPVDLSSESALVELAKVLVEDVCLLHHADGQWRLVAGVVVFPSRWDLREKIGKTIDEIHQPVPSYSEQLEPLLSDSFDRLSSDRPVWRRNWSLHTTPQLHEPRFSGERATPENYWWRTERQTLTKSPDGKYLLFTIRNRAEPFSWIKQNAEASKAFAETLRTLSDSMLDYKRIREDKEKLISYLLS
jgi:hypothetical protein